MIDLQYSINIKSNISGFEILFNGESKGIIKAAGKNLPLTLNQIQNEFGGRVDIRLQKTNYISSIRYELVVIKNPAFQNSNNFSLEGANFLNPEDLQSLENIRFSNIPEFVLFVNKYENDELLNDTQDFSTELINLEFDLKSNLKKGDESTNNNNIKIKLDSTLGSLFEDTNENFRVVLNGVLESAKFIINKTEQIVVDKNAGVYNFKFGDVVDIVSSDLTKFRITQITAKGIDIDSSQSVENDLQSLSFNVLVSKPLVITITTAEVFANTQTLPSIGLLKGEENRNYNINTKTDYPISIFKNNEVSSLRVIVKDNEIFYNIPANQGIVDSKFVILIPEKFISVIGKYNIQIIPNNSSGDGNPIEFVLNVVNEVWVGVPDIKNIRFPSRIEGPDYVGYDVDFEIAYESINTDYVKIAPAASLVDNQSPSFIKGPASGKVLLNIKNLLELPGIGFSESETEISITLNLIPFNESGISVVNGKTEIIQIKFSKSSLTIPRNIAVNRVAEGFISQFDAKILETESSKYLTHTLHLGSGNNKVITTWTGSYLGNDNSLILKLYEPLPTSVQPNQQVWISKYQSNPIIETITISGLEAEFCTPLKGPNFSLEPDTGIGYNIYDELIASGSQTSNDLVLKYLKSTTIDTSKLNIQYVSDTGEYLFKNFVNFGSAEERINNFFYKIQLIERYQTILQSLIYRISVVDGSLLTEDFFLIITETGDFSIDIEKIAFSNPSELAEANKIIQSIYGVLKSFDGFEKYLMSSRPLPEKGFPLSLGYPKDIIVNEFPITITPSPDGSGQTTFTFKLKPTENTDVISWYENALAVSSEFDKYNPNYIVNNIPEFIYTDNNNADFLLFLDMIGQHFDTVWVHINALTQMKVVDEGGLKGIPNGFVLNMLKSLGWDGRRAFDSQFLWEYALGQNKDGTPKYSTSLEDANNQVWRRILNNLPYLLKHKGTARAMKAIMACYGVPQSMLTIMEFGGPQDPTKGGVSKFTFDDRTAALRLQSTASVVIPWKIIPSTGLKPQGIEFMLKPDSIENTTNIVSGSDFLITLQAINERDSELILNLNGIIETSPSFSLSTQHYSNILVNKTNININDAQYDFFLNTSNGENIILSVSASITASNSVWESGSYISIGNDFTGALDEVRLWRVPLQYSKFENHTLFPDAINGNSVSASTTDLMFRLDFEYPKDRVLDPFIKNVAITQVYSEGFATASNFYSASSYPYQYIPYERTVTANVPSLGFNYANKIRFEEQELVTELSYKHRATKKSFDRAPIDSNRLGLFLSPIKELNMDILKAFGDFNIDNYIGNPADQYRAGYKELDTLRAYYFERLNLNVGEYIQLVKYINKSLFDVLADLAPARAKISKGLLIEPHFLERNKVQWNRPDAENISYHAEVHIEDVESIEMEYNTFEAIIKEENNTILEGKFNTFLGEIKEEDQIQLVANTAFYVGEFNYITDEFFIADIPTFETQISYELRYELLGELETFGKYESVGNQANSMDNLGFGLYAEDTTTIWKKYDFNSNYTESRANVFLVESERLKNILTQVSGFPRAGAGPNEQVEYALVSTPFKEYVVSILPFPDTLGVSGNITNVTPLRGYFPTHYKFKNNLPEGLQRTFFKGSIQNATTTPDGLSPVETFTTNPNILRVANTGRGSGEPILIVD